MPLWAVNTSGKGWVIANGASAKIARDFATGEFGGYGAGMGAPTHLATQADIDRYPLLGTLMRGITDPASIADPQLISSFGFSVAAPGQGANEPTAGGTTNAPPADPPPTTYEPPPAGGNTKGNAAPEPLVWVQNPLSEWNFAGGTVTRSEEH